MYFDTAVQPHTIPKANKKPKTTPTSTQPFCCVDKQTVVDPKLADNSFEAKVISNYNSQLLLRVEQEGRGVAKGG